MRILLFIDYLGSGGAQRQMVELAKGFIENNHDVEFLVYYDKNFYRETLSDLNIKVHLIPVVNPFLRTLQIRKFIRKNRFNAVIAFLETPSFIATLASIPNRKWKFIIGERSANPLIIKSFKHRFLRLWHIFADYVVANSQTNLSMVKQANPFLPDKKLKVIYNIIDNQKWDTLSDNDKSSYNHKFILTVASRHHYLKNLKGLIEGVHLLDDIHKKRLIINWFGDYVEPPYYDQSYLEGKKLIKQYKLNDIFHFYPATQSLPLEFKRSDAIGLFSFYEGFPNVICEAIASKKVVISSKVSDIPQFIEQKELLFNPENPFEIKDSIKSILEKSSTELNRIAQYNYSMNIEKFNKEKIVKMYLNLIS